MTDFTIDRAAAFDGKDVALEGWLYNLRESGKLLFPIFRDGTGLMQGVVSKAEVSAEVWQRAASLTQESSVIARGTVRRDARAPGGYELIVRDLEVVQRVPENEPYPISPKEHGVDFLLNHRHLWIRSTRQAALLRIRAEVMRAAREYLDSHGYFETSSPILTPAACEGTTTLFGLDYFDLGRAYLTQSGQLYIEATAAALGKVYCFGPTFRAEKSKTRRHLTEFWMVEPEVAWNDSDDNMRLQEEFICYIVGRCLERRKAELAELERDTAPLARIAPPFPRISYTEAVEKLAGLGADITWGRDLGGDDETLLA